jgi:hypothetical protein
MAVLAAVVMRALGFWDTAPCSPLKVNRHFGGIYLYRFHLEGQRISRARNHREAGNRALFPASFLSGLFFTLKMEATYSSEKSLLSTGYTALYPRRNISSYYSTFLKHVIQGSYSFSILPYLLLVKLYCNVQKTFPIIIITDPVSTFYLYGSI